MTKEETIQQELIKKFPYLNGKFRIQRERRMYADVPQEKFAEVFDYAVKEAGFSYLSTITGLDEGANLSFVYHLARENAIILSIKTSVPKDNPVISTVTGYFPGANLYERELMDLLGAKIEGLPEGRRYPLPDDWPVGQHPLRKDWKPETPQGKENK